MADSFVAFPKALAGCCARFGRRSAWLFVTTNASGVCTNPSSDPRSADNTSDHSHRLAALG